MLKPLTNKLLGGTLRSLSGQSVGFAVLGVLICSLSGTGAPQQGWAANYGTSQSTQDSPATTKKSDGAKVAESAKEAENLDASVYRIGVEDDLQISVWKEPDLTVNVVVRPDGMITMPLLNDIAVVGLKTTELQALLTEKLKPFVNEPQVTIVVRGIKSRKVYVYGQVNKAGAYPLVGKKTVLEALADAGGLSLFAKKGSIYVLREGAGKKTRIPFNYNNALKGKNPNDNFELLPGDIIVVP
jgi:polysaccharide export outer membrane protein